MTDTRDYDDTIARLIGQFKVSGDQLEALARKKKAESRRAALEELARSAQTYLVDIAAALHGMDTPVPDTDERNDAISAAMRLRELLDPNNDEHRRLPLIAQTADGHTACAGRSERGAQNDVELYIGDRHEISVDLTPQNARRLALHLYQVADALDDEYPNRPPR